MKLLGRPLPMLIGLLAAGAAGWGLYHLMLIGSCSSPPSGGLPPCPPGSERYFGAVFVGMFLAIPMVMAGGWIVFAALFGSIGLAGVYAARTETGPDWMYGFGAIFLAVPAFMVLGFLFAMGKQRKAEHLVANGIEAIGTVLSVDDTGVTVNSSPRLRLRLRIEPVDGYPAPFEATKTTTVSRVAIPRPGDRLPVWIDRDDHSTWGFATAIDSTASMQARALWDLAKRTAAPAAPQPLAAPAGPDAALLQELAALNDLRARGAIGDRDFAARTAQLVRRLSGSA